MLGLYSQYAVIEVDCENIAHILPADVRKIGQQKLMYWYKIYIKYINFCLLSFVYILGRMENVLLRKLIINVTNIMYCLSFLLVTYMASYHLMYKINVKIVVGNL